MAGTRKAHGSPVLSRHGYASDMISLEAPSPRGGGSPPKAAGWGDLVPHDGPISKIHRARARRLRHAVNDAEKRLWRHLRRLTLQGSHFRRQVPIGPYVVDFACLAARLIIELDGSQHSKDANRARDQARARWLEKEHYRVVRFWNNEIVGNIDGVMQMIYVELYGSPDAETFLLKHSRTQRSRSAVTPPRRASSIRADPPPPGEGKQKLVRTDKAMKVVP
jgi:very-short-patch-repair endonuclease